jgi:hypothetical protein
MPTYWPQKTQSSFKSQTQSVTTERSYEAWNKFSKNNAYTVQTSIPTKPISTKSYGEFFGAFYKDSTGGSQTYFSDRRDSPRERQHRIAWSREESTELQMQGYSRLPQKNMAQRGFHMSNLKMTRYNIPNAVSKRGGMLGKSLGAIAMIGVNMLMKSAMDINKGARMVVDYAVTKSVLGAGRLGLQRSSTMYRPPAGLSQALSKSRHGR